MKPHRYVGLNSGRSIVPGALLLLLALLLPFAAPAANENEIRNYIISINHLYENLDYELALSRIQLARQLPRSTDDEVTLSLYEGIILYELRRLGPADSVFKSALLLRPDAKLPVQVSPKVVALFESVRKQVKQEVASLLPPSGTEKTSNATEEKHENPPAPPSMAPSPEKREDAKLAQSPKKEEPQSVETKATTAQVADADTKLPLMPPPPSTQKADQKKEEPVAVQPHKSPNCGSKPASVSSRDQKDQQLWLLASMRHELCLSGKFQGLVAERWTKLKTRVERATNSYERPIIDIEIKRFARDAQREAELREAERLEAERREAKRREKAEQSESEAERLDAERALIKKKLSDTANLDTTKCQPVVSTHCMRELIMQRLRIIQEAFLRTNPSSKLQPIRELVTIGNEIRAASTSEELLQKWEVLNAWQRRHLSQ